MLRNIYLLLVFSTIIVTSCTYNSEEDLYPEDGCLTENMSYQDDILPIITTDCYGCHNVASNFGNITLEGYDEISKHVASGELIGSIKHAAGYSPMPQGSSKLLDCEIEKIESWINDGAPNN